MILADFIFVASHLKIHPALYLNTSKALPSLYSKRKVYQKLISFRYSHVLTRPRKKIKLLVAVPLDVQIEQPRILI